MIDAVMPFVEILVLLLGANRLFVYFVIASLIVLSDWFHVATRWMSARSGRAEGNQGGPVVAAALLAVLAISVIGLFVMAQLWWIDLSVEARLETLATLFIFTTLVIQPLFFVRLGGWAHDWFYSRERSKA